MAINQSSKRNVKDDKQARNERGKNSKPRVFSKEYWTTWRKAHSAPGEWDGMEKEMEMEMEMGWEAATYIAPLAETSRYQEDSSRSLLSRKGWVGPWPTAKSFKQCTSIKHMYNKGDQTTNTSTPPPREVKAESKGLV